MAGRPKVIHYFGARLQTTACASIKPDLAVQLNEQQHLNFLITIGQFLGPITKSYVLLHKGGPRVCEREWTLNSFEAILRRVEKEVNDVA